MTTIDWITDERPLELARQGVSPCDIEDYDGEESEELLAWLDDNLFDIADEFRGELIEMWIDSRAVQERPKLRSPEPDYVAPAKPKDKPARPKPERKKEEYRPLSPVDGYVYLVSGGNGMYKIGITINLESRFKGLQAQSPVPLELVHHFYSTQYRQDERTLHSHFEDKRSHYEWFELDDEDVEYIKSIGDNQSSTPRTFEF